MVSTPVQGAGNSKSSSENGESQNNKTSHLPTPEITPEKLKQAGPLIPVLNMAPLFTTPSSAHTKCSKKRKLGEDSEKVENNRKKIKLGEETDCETAAQPQPDKDASPNPISTNLLFDTSKSPEDKMSLHQSDPKTTTQTSTQKKLSKHQRFRAWKRNRAAEVPLGQIFHPVLRRNIKRGKIHDQIPEKMDTYWEYEWDRLRPIEKFPEDEGLDFEEWKSKMDWEDFMKE